MRQGQTFAIFVVSLYLFYIILLLYLHFFSSALELFNRTSELNNACCCSFLLCKNNPVGMYYTYFCGLINQIQFLTRLTKDMADLFDGNLNNNKMQIKRKIISNKTELCENRERIDDE